MTLDLGTQDAWMGYIEQMQQPDATDVEGTTPVYVVAPSLGYAKTWCHHRRIAAWRLRYIHDPHQLWGLSNVTVAVIDGGMCAGTVKDAADEALWTASQGLITVREESLECETT